MCYKCFLWLFAILLLVMVGCSKAYWKSADPYLERYLIAKPPQNIKVDTNPHGARVVIASLRNPQLYSGYATVNIRFRPHPHIPSWILVAKEGYRSTAIKIEKDARDTNLYVSLAILNGNEIDQPNIMSGPMMGKPYTPMGQMGQMMQPSSMIPGRVGQMMAPPF